MLVHYSRWYVAAQSAILPFLACVFHQKRILQVTPVLSGLWSSHVGFNMCILNITSFKTQLRTSAQQGIYIWDMLCGKYSHSRCQDSHFPPISQVMGWEFVICFI